MRSFAVDSNNDLFIGTDRNLAFVSGIDAIAQNSVTAVKAQRVEMIYATNQGMPTRGTAWDTYNPSQFEAAVRQIILGVSGVNSISAFSLFKQDNVLQYSATIKTIYGSVKING